MPTRLASLAGALAAGVMAVAAVWMALHQPMIDDTACRSAYDTVIHHARTTPASDVSDRSSVTTRCRSLGHVRFDLAILSGALSIAFAGVTVVVVVRRIRA